MNSIKILSKIFFVVAYVFCLTNAGIIQNGKNNLDTTSTGTFDDDTLRKNDDSHLRLFYKSNSPDRSISHEMEHRLLKNPNIQYVSPIQPESTFQTKFSPQYSMNYLDPRLFSAFKSNNDLVQAANRNKQTLLNLHYHGNSIPGLDTTLNRISDHPNVQESEMQRKIQAANMLKMLLMNFYPSQKMFALPKYVNQARYESFPAKNDLQYKILNLKLKIQPEQGRIFGDGFIHSDNQAEWFNKKKSSILSRELPEIIKRLISTTQSLTFPNSQMERANFLNKRNDEDFKTNQSDDNYDKKDNYKRNSIKSEKMSQKRKETDYFTNNNNEEKINESELSESFKSLQRRENSDYVSREDENFKNLNFKSEEEIDSKES